MPAKRTPSRKARKRHAAIHPYIKPEVKPKIKKPRLQPGPSHKNIIVRPLGAKTPLEGFFSRYPEFPYQPSTSPLLEFDRLCEWYDWESDDPKKKAKAARKAFRIAMKEEFDDLYGSDENDIKNWHKLCHVLGISPVPDTLRECRAAVLGKHVNLVDLVHGSKVEVRIFETEEELSEYTQETEKYFPKEDAQDGGVLRALRRHILAPRARPRDDTSSSKRNKYRKDSRR